MTFCKRIFHLLSSSNIEKGNIERGNLNKLLSINKLRIKVVGNCRFFFVTYYKRKRDIKITCTFVTVR